MTAELLTGLPVPVNRFFSAKDSAALGQAYEASGLVDFAFAWDQMMGWWPEHLWQQYGPGADVVTDGSSFADPYITLAAVATLTTKLGIVTTTDGLRRGPAEFLQTALTLAGLTEAPTTIFIGAGEIKQANPFGHKRSQGLARLEDTFRLVRLLLDAEGPVDYDGNIWKYKDAWMGRGRVRVPKFFAMGAGPRLLDLATKYADGLFSVAPQAHSRPETVAEEIVQVKQQVERADRDPDEFRYALMYNVLLTEDENEYDRFLDHPIVRYLAGIGGRLRNTDWEKEGLESVMPLDWHYALHWIPARVTPAEADDIISRTSRAMAEKFVLAGSTKKVAGQVAEFAEAGASMHTFLDVAPLLRPVEQAPLSIANLLAVCGHLKGAPTAPASG